MSADVAGDIVVFNEALGLFKGLSGPAIDIWNAIDGERDAAAIAALLVERYEVDVATCEADVVPFLAKLADAGLIVEA